MIILKSYQEIESMRLGGRILAQVMEEIGKMIRPGISTKKIDSLAEKMILEVGGVPAFKGYGGESGRPFPATICASLNDEIVHGIPSEKIILKEGDLLKIDIGMKYQELITDMARTWAVGKISKEARKILDVTCECLNIGIEKIQEGGYLSQYSCAVEKHVNKAGFFVVRDLVGHGVGRKLHEDPIIPNYKSKEGDVLIKKGMTFALEPMVNVGTYKMNLKKDGWTYVTQDGSLSAHFEDTIAITSSGVEILTRM